jgi:hypothetical protein
LVGFFEKFNQVSNDATIATVEKGSGKTGISSTASTTNTMNIIVNISGEVVVDNMSDIGDLRV